MKIATIEIGGGSYPAAFSLQVLSNLEDRTGKPAGEALDALLGSEQLSVRDLVWLLSQLLEAGAKASGSKLPYPTEEELLNNYALDDFSALAASVLSTVHTAHPSIKTEGVGKTQKKTKITLRTLFG